MCVDISSVQKKLVQIILLPWLWKQWKITVTCYVLLFFKGALQNFGLSQIIVMVLDLSVGSCNNHIRSDLTNYIKITDSKSSRRYESRNIIWISSWHVLDMMYSTLSRQRQTKLYFRECFLCTMYTVYVVIYLKFI